MDTVPEPVRRILCDILHATHMHPQNVIITKVSCNALGSTYRLQSQGTQLLSLFVKCYQRETCDPTFEPYFSNEVMFYGDVLDAMLNEEVSSQSKSTSDNSDCSAYVGFGVSGNDCAVSAKACDKGNRSLPIAVAKCYKAVSPTTTTKASTAAGAAPTTLRARQFRNTGATGDGADDDDAYVIVLDNVIVRGFSPCSVHVGLGETQSRAVLGALAEFHAQSLALKTRRRRRFDRLTGRLREMVFRADLAATHGAIFERTLADALQLARAAFPAHSMYVRKLELAFADHPYEKMCALIAPCSSASESASGFEVGANDEYSVLTHGDLWPNNILHSAANTVRFIDFQGCRVASPVHDLMMVLLVAVDRYVRERCREDLLKCYHHAFCLRLIALGCDPIRVFPYSALRQQLQRHTRFALATILVGLPIYMDTGNIVNGNNVGGDSYSADDDADELASYIQSVGQRKSMKCKNKMLEVIMDVVDEGYLD